MPKELKTWNNLPSFGKLVVALMLIVPTFAFAQLAVDEEDVEELEAFVMTGSRIKRLDIETVNPVIQLTAANIEETGFTTIGEALRALPFNSGQALTPTDAGTSFTPGISSINLRGLGNNNTLVLVNGRRTAKYAASGYDGLQSMFDLNSIPAGAIESIEILKDGASAIYGSDAIAGVMNVVLKKDYQGLSTKFDIGNYFNTGENAFHYGTSLVVGSSTAKTSFTAAVSFSYDEALAAKDVDYASDADHRETLALDANARWVHSDPAGIDAAMQDLYGLDLDWWENSFLEAAPTWFDLRSSRGFPGYLTYNGGSYTSDTATPTLDDMYSGTNLYNYQETSGFNSEVKNFSFYNLIHHDFTDTLYGFLEFSFSRIESESRSAGATLDIESSKGLTEGDDMYMPAGNPYNVFDVDIYNGRRRFVEMGNRINDVQSDTPRFLVGLGGEFANDWTWESGLLYAKNTVTNISFAAVDYKLQQALMGLGVNSDGSLFWDPTLAQEDRRYFNWFGLNGIEMVDFITVYNPNISEYKLYQWDASVAGNIVEINGGMIGMAAGVEARRESLKDIKTDLNATEMILGGSAGTGFEGEREVQSAYVEFSIPVLENLEFQLAGRYEKYSDDGFESEIRPKVAVKYRPTDWMILRASYNQSFKAPDLAYLYTASNTSFTSFQILDPITGDKIDQMQIKTEGNDALAPELTDSYYAGVVLEPGGILEGLTFSVDYFNLQQSNLLAQLSDFYTFSEILLGAADGNPLFADKVVRSSETNQVLFMRDVYENISEAEYTGFDFQLSYNWETESFGQFFAKLDVTYLHEYTIDGDDRSGNKLRPSVRANAMLNWRRGDWSASVFVNYIKGREVAYWDTDVKYYADLYLGPGMSEEYTSALVYDIDDQYVVNPRVSYKGFYDSTITFGVNNVFDSNPPADPDETSGSVAGVQYMQPAFWYLQFEKEF